MYQDPNQVVETMARTTKGDGTGGGGSDAMPLWLIPQTVDHRVPMSTHAHNGGLSLGEVAARTSYGRPVKPAGQPGDRMRRLPGRLLDVMVERRNTESLLSLLFPGRGG